LKRTTPNTGEPAILLSLTKAPESQSQITSRTKITGELKLKPSSQPRQALTGKWKNRGGQKSSRSISSRPEFKKADEILKKAYCTTNILRELVLTI
jgi:hypothetical protein